LGKKSDSETNQTQEQSNLADLLMQKMYMRSLGWQTLPLPGMLFANLVGVVNLS
jgi:hypothetical protein